MEEKRGPDRWKVAKNRGAERGSDCDGRGEGGSEQAGINRETRKLPRIEYPR